MNNNIDPREVKIDTRKSAKLDPWYVASLAIAFAVMLAALACVRLWQYYEERKADLTPHPFQEFRLDHNKDK